MSKLDTTKYRNNSRNHYTEADKQRVLDLVRNGATLQDIEGDKLNPSWQTIQNWRFTASGAPTPFNLEYSKAICERADRWADLCVKETNELPEDCTHEQINRQRLRNGVRMWRCSVDHRNRFGTGDKTQVQVGIAVALTEDQRLQLIERRERGIANSLGR